MKWTNKGHQFDKIADCIMDNDVSYYIWGAGNSGKFFYELLHKRIHIAAFLDIDETKQHKGSDDTLPVLPPENIKTLPYGKIIVSPAYYSEISRILELWGYRENIDFFEEKMFTAVFLLYKYDELYIYRTDISITEKCTLKCKKCNMFMPFFTAPEHSPLKRIIENIDSYFAVVSHVNYMNLLGGEPFMHPEFTEILEYIGRNYRENIGILEIFTNGMLSPTDEQIRLMKKYRINVGVSDYSSRIPYGERLKKTIETLSGAGIQVRHEIYENWMDFGFPDNIPSFSNETDIEEHARNCGALFRGLYRKRFYYCHLNTSAERAGIFEANPDNYFELEGNINKKELLEFDLGYSERGYCTFCSVCRGCQSAIQVEAALQV